MPGLLAYFKTENCIWIFLSYFGTNTPKHILVNVSNDLALVIIQNISRLKYFNSACE